MGRLFQRMTDKKDNLFFNLETTETHTSGSIILLPFQWIIIPESVFESMIFYNSDDLTIYGNEDVRYQ